MNSQPSATLGAHPSTVLSAYLEPLVRGRRVAVLGDASVGLAEALSTRGARLVHGYDPDPGRVAEAIARSGGSGHVAHGVFGPDPAVRDGAFDVVVVQDLSIFADPAEALRRVRKLCAGSGVAVVASPNAEVSRRLGGGAPAAGALGYYDLFDAVSMQFGTVRMVGQAPFVGYAVADFAPDGEPDVTVDTSLLEAPEEPEWFLAIGSERPVALDPFALVELPLGDETAGPSLDRHGGRHAAPARDVPSSLGDDRLALTEAQTRLALVTAELEALREQRNKAEARAAAAAAQVARLSEGEGDVAALRGRLRELEAKAGDSHVRAERLANDRKELEEELARQRDRATRLAKQLDDEKKARTKADVELGMMKTKPEIAAAKDRLADLSGELAQAHARIAELERERSAYPKGMSMRAPALEGRIEELTAKLSAATETAAEDRGARDEARSRIAEVEQERDAARRGRDGAQRDVNEARKRLAELEDELDAARRARDEAQRARTHAEQALLVTAAEPEADVVADVAALEDALRRRGEVVSRLERDLAESERIGRELLGELEELRATVVAHFGPEGAGGAAQTEPAAPAAPAASTAVVAAPADVGIKLDQLAERAAKSEADVLAANWRIADLERRLAEAGAGRQESQVHAELEQALVASQAEVARLRRTLGGEPEAPSPELSPAT